jgi:hypothetical protein
MMKKVLIISAFITFSASVTAQSVPDVRGTWVGTSNAAVRGSARHHPGNAMDEISFNQKQFTWIFDRQEGRNFSGSTTSKHNTEPLIGAFAADLKSGVIANSDGRNDFTMVGNDQMNICYSHANAQSVVVNCIDFKRQK